MKEFINRLRTLCDTYRNDAEGVALALDRDATAEVLRRDAAQLRRMARMDGCDVATARDALVLARKLSDRASSVAASTRLQSAAVRDARLAPRLSACGTPRAVYVDPTSDVARASAGAVQRASHPAAHALRGDRGTYIAYLRREGCEIDTHKVRHARKRKRRGGQKHKVREVG